MPATSPATPVQVLAGPESASPLYATSLPLPNRRSGKVRDIYDLPAEPGSGPRLLIVASDRLSAYDVIMPTPFPGKGRLLTSISLSWFDFIATRKLCASHLISADASSLPIPPSDRQSLAGRVMICRKSRVVPIECVARGYLAGSGWKEYQESRSVCGVPLPAGLKQCDRLPEPIFTPATKEATGHDENISFERMVAIVGAPLAARLRDLTLTIYKAAAEYALARGIIIADTKFEFGFALDAAGNPTTELLLIDEVLTPDSSRFWPVAGYEPGHDQPSFDKQYLRNYLEGLVARGLWHKSPPGPAIPADIVSNTMARYAEARQRLFGGA